MTDDLPNCLTTRELANHWQVSCRTLERWRAEHYGPIWVTIGGSVRYRKDDVLAWEAAHRSKTNHKGTRS